MSKNKLTPEIAAAVCREFGYVSNSQKHDIARALNFFEQGLTEEEAVKAVLDENDDMEDDS